MSKICAVVLAAGEGKRMKAAMPKAMTEVLFQPMIDWVLDALDESGIDEKILIVGHYGEQLVDYVGGECQIAWQKERLGTGHAAMQAVPALKENEADNVLILNGDAPFIDAETIGNSLEAHIKDGNAVTVVSAEVDDPTGYGRILKNANGELIRIVEQKDADRSELAVKEINSGMLWFRKEDLLDALDKLTPSEVSGEYYLTDTISILKKEGKRTGVFTAANSNVVLGANDRLQLLELNDIARKAVLKKHLLNGVDIPCIDGIIIGKDVEIAAGTQILPNTILKGRTTVGAGCTLGPNTMVYDSTIKDGVQLNNVFFEDSVIENGANVGPFSHIRPNTHLAENVHVGNFVEVKNSNIGKGTKVPHLTYVGDSDVGEGCNFGCGSLTVNYDGKIKHRTTIEDHAFIGCNTNLVAPVKVGAWAFTAAGSTITDDVPENALAVARSYQKNIEDWVTRKKPYKNMK